MKIRTITALLLCLPLIGCKVSASDLVGKVSDGYADNAMYVEDETDDMNAEDSEEDEEGEEIDSEPAGGAE